MPSAPRTPSVREQFERVFGHPCAVVARAPGRVNLIGEHTDYNDGFVFPMALEQCTWVAAAPRSDGRVRSVAADLPDDRTWPVAEWARESLPHWTAYVAGVAALLRARAPHFAGADLLITSTVPVGSGLSSSAALEVATAAALAALGDLALPPTALADLARRAEHEYAGVPCGIMDQYISVLGRPGAALLLDCRGRTWEHVPLALPGHTFVIVNSGVRHKLASGEYAARQQQCQTAVAHFRRLRPEVRALRDVTPGEVAAEVARLDATVAARARHVVTENERTLAAAGALRRGDLAEFGRLMRASHVSLRDDYQVSCRELDLLVEIIGAVSGVRGVRMTGGGFGGCVVALAETDCVPRIEAALREQYDAAGNGPAQLILSRPGAGAAVEYRG